MFSTPKTVGCLCCLASLVGAINVAAVERPGSSNMPQLPQQYVDTTIDASYDRAADIVVAAGDDLQAALNAAQPGDIVELEAGATWIGNFVLPNKAGNEWIYIRSSRYQELPGPGTRIGPEHAHLMPKIETTAPTTPALNSAQGAHNFRLIGIEFLSNVDTNQIIQLGTGYPNYVSDANNLPRDIILDRVYVHGHQNYRSGIGIQLQGASVAVVDSYISEIHHDGKDTQAIFAFNTTGPIKLVNNFLEAAGENVMFGGADPVIPGIVPSDIEIRGNLFSKPLSWKNPIASGPHAGAKWSVKNLFELKNARRVLVEGNIFEHNWAASQRGVAIQLTPRNQNGTAPQSTVEDVTFRYNIVRDSKHFLNILSSDTQTGSSQTTSRLLFENNLIYDIDDRLIELSAGFGYPPSNDLVFRHNTMVHGSDGSPNTFLTVGDDTVADGFTFVDNIVTHGAYGFHWPSGTIDDWVVNYDITNNVVSGGNRNVPAGNYVNVSFNSIGFLDPANDDYHLTAGSQYKKRRKTGSDCGADIDKVIRATANATASDQTPKRQSSEP